jgi:serine/threonine-protein kinase RsbW
MTTTASFSDSTGPAPVIVSVPASPASIGIVRQAVTGVADLIDMPAPLQDDVRVAVTEAVTNAVIHAYPDGGGRVRVDMWPDTGTMTVVVSDHGCGIVPSVDRMNSGLGLGLRLIAALASSVSITANSDGSGTQVGMIFSDWSAHR